MVDCRGNTIFWLHDGGVRHQPPKPKGKPMSDIDFSKTHMNNWLSQQGQQRSRKTGPSAFIAVAILAAVVYAGYTL